MRPTIFLATPTPKTMEEVMPIIDKLSEEMLYLIKIDELLTELIFPQAHFLLDKWHIWSTDETSFCYMFLRKAGWDAYPATYNSMADYWVHFVAPRINYKFTIRRGNLGTRVKAAFNGLLFFYLMLLIGTCIKYLSHG